MITKIGDVGVIEVHYPLVQGTNDVPEYGMDVTVADAQALSALLNGYREATKALVRDKTVLCIRAKEGLLVLTDEEATANRDRKLVHTRAEGPGVLEKATVWGGISFTS